MYSLLAPLFTTTRPSDPIWGPGGPGHSAVVSVPLPSACILQQQLHGTFHYYGRPQACPLYHIPMSGFERASGLCEYSLAVNSSISEKTQRCFYAGGSVGVPVIASIPRETARGSSTGGFMSPILARCLGTQNR